jgi:hypothetical protein
MCNYMHRLIPCSLCTLLDMNANEMHILKSDVQSLEYSIFVIGKKHARDMEMKNWEYFEKAC